MDNRRFVTLLVVFFAFNFLWQAFVVPRFAPNPLPQQEADNKDESGVAADPEVAAADTDADPDTDEPGDGEPKPDKPDKPVAEVVADHPDRTVTLGSVEPDSGFFLQVNLTAAGAAIDSVQLADPKFGELDDREKPLSVIRSQQPLKDGPLPRTFATAVNVIDEQLRNSQQSLETINWEVSEVDDTAATFAFEAPDGSVRIQKTYRLTKVDVPEKQRRKAFQNNLAGWTIAVELKVSNLSDSSQTIEYEIQGPVGVVLENETHTSKYRDIKLEFLNDDDAVAMPAVEVNSVYEDRYEEEAAEGEDPDPEALKDLVERKDAWTSPIRYAAVDVQFFAAILSPRDKRELQERIDKTWISRVWPVMIRRNLADVDLSDISFRCKSAEIVVPAGHSLTHSYDFFAGPKRRQLLDPEPLVATKVLNFGDYFGSIVRGMHSLLDMFHGWGLPYALAILSLTILVRACMFPLSRKQAIMSARQKKLAPKLQELKVKYGDDKQKFAHAQMDLMRKEGVNPLSGCLPVLIQCPLFIGLYWCLNTAIDLRLSRFLWIDNLAAPDALFTMPRLPYLGTDFSILPCITVVLFFAQQKLFMPEPTDEQTAATQKMMSYMTLAFGFMFWHQPSGLCIYFIASSLWGIAERTLLGNVAPPAATEPSVVVKDPSEGNRKNHSGKGAEPKKQGLFGRLVETIEEAQRQAEKQQKEKEKDKGKDKDKKKGKKKGR